MCMYDNRNTVFTLMKLAHAYMYDNRNTVFTLMKLAHAYMYIHTYAQDYLCVCTITETPCSL